MAPVVHEMTGGVLMGRTGYETREIGFCTVAPERIITDPDITGRAFGEKILGAMTPEQREKKMLAQDLADMRKAIQRRREHMARQVLLTGKLSMFVYTNEGAASSPRCWRITALRRISPRTPHGTMRRKDRSGHAGNDRHGF